MSILKMRARQLLSGLAILCFTYIAPDANAGQYRAFYYDAQGLLLQVEDVRDENIEGRNLIDVNDSLLVVPMLTQKDTPLISGANIPMSRFAMLAVYYTYEPTEQARATGDRNVGARPAKVEYLGFVSQRTLAKCLARDSSTPCLFPKRCHCMVKTCCCY